MAYFCYPLARLFYLRHSVLSPCLLPYLTRYPVHIWLRPTTLHFVCCRYCCLCLCVCQYMWSEKLLVHDFVCLFEVLFYIANQTGTDAQYYDGDRITSVAR